MDGNTRRKEIFELLKNVDKPISGTKIADHFGVSRQVIVQDIALMRANNKNIMSTNRGYILFKEDSSNITKIFYVSHADEDIKDELYTIIDNGGIILDVIVEHDVYGMITVDLYLKSREDVDDFCSKNGQSSCLPLKTLTGSNHYHTVEVKNESDLLKIEKKLRCKGYIK